MDELAYREMRIRSFRKRVSKRKTKNGCILWKGAVTPSGYGQHIPWINNETLSAHRLAYLIHYGEFDRKLCVLHKCDNPPCVNPEHLFLGTHKENTQDMLRKGRRNH